MSTVEVKAFIPTFKYYTRNGVTSSVASGSYHNYRRKTGYNGPRILTNGQPLPIHPFDATWHFVNATVKEVRVWSATDLSVEEGPALSRTPTQIVFDPPHEYTAINAKALEKLNGKIRGDLDLSIDAFQARQTVKMLKATDSLESYTKTFTRKWGLLKVPAQAWLEYTYGIKPFVQDIYATAEERIRIVINQLERVKARAIDWSYRPSRVFISTVYGAIYRDIGDFAAKLSTTIGITYKGTAPNWENYTSLNPVSIAWELLPYSFVVDWVYDVGGYLRAVETACLFANRFDSGYRTNLIAYRGEIRQDFKYTSYPTGFNEWRGQFEGLGINRSVLTQYPSQDLPILKVDLGSSRLLSAASLLAGHLGRRPPGPRVI
jgi:hypothetical protein